MLTRCTFSDYHEVGIHGATSGFASDQQLYGEYWGYSSGGVFYDHYPDYGFFYEASVIRIGSRLSKN